MPDNHQPDRSVLPIPDQPYDGVLPLDAKDPDATFPPIEPLRPPRGAPNVQVRLQPVRPAALPRRGRSDHPCRHASGARGVRLPRRGARQGGTASLYVDGDKVGEGRVEATVPMLFSADETCDLGSDAASPVSDDYTPEESRFNGTVNWVQLDIAEAAEDVDHLISPEERPHVAMARQ